MIDFDKNRVFRLKADASYGAQVAELLVPGEQVVDAYSSGRDGVVFTDKRVICLNVQGLTGKKRDFTSIPYSKIQAYSVETAGTFDLDSELEVYVSAVGKVRFEFSGKSSIVGISKHISAGAL